MSRKLGLLTALIIVLAGTLGLAFKVQRVEASGTIYIRADGSVDPPTANITSSDNVTYYFTDNNYDSIVVERDNIVVDGVGYTVEGTGRGTGIDLSHRTNVTVKNTKVIEFYRGIFLVDSYNNTLTGNTVANSRYYGVVLSSSSNNTLRSNNMTSNTYNFGVYGDELRHFLHDVDTSNLVDGKPVYFLLNQHYLIINPSTFPNIGYLALVNSTKITVENLTLKNNWEALVLAYTTNSSIIGNNITNNYYGIWLLGSSNNTLSSNSATNNGGHGIWLDTSPLNALTGNTITNNYVGIELHKSSNNTLSANTIRKNTCGIWLYNSSNTIIAGNTVADGYLSGEYGIRLSGSYNTMSNNTITNNWYGILLSGSYNTLRNNNIASNEKAFKVSGSTLSDFLHDIDASNLVDGRPIYYWVNQHDAEVPSDAGYIGLVNCTGITINNLTLTKKWQGLLIAYTNNSIITNNNIVNNEISIDIFSSSSNVLSGNNITNNDVGINLESSNHNILSRNKISSNRLYGIALWSSSNNSITGNDVKNSDYGIHLTSSSNNTLLCNTVADNDYYGITLLGWWAADNVIFHNNFINNPQQVWSIYWNSNTWDNGYISGGNYWSDYTGVDTNMDGVGNSSYEIGLNNIDRYPLKGVFSSFNTSLGKHVNVVSNSTIEDFEYFESNSTIKMYVSNMTANQTFGFCRVCIPHTLMDVSNISVIIDDGAVEVLYFNDTIYDNDTHRWIYFAYPHSIHEIVIIPEFPSFFILPLFMIATLLAVIVYRLRNH